MSNFIMRMLPIILVATLNASAVAQSKVEVTQCKPDGTQQEMNQCAYQDYQVADKQLNQVYKKTLATLNAERQRLLRDEQRTWLKARDPACKAESIDSEGGSMWPLVFYGCLQERTVQRTKAIAAWKGKQ